jgi:hypothetical protein
MSIAALAEETKLAPNTIKRAESTDGPAPITSANAALMVATLEKHGVCFIPADEYFGPGVRLKLPADMGGTQPQRRRRLVSRPD